MNIIFPKRFTAVLGFRMSTPLKTAFAVLLAVSFTARSQPVIMPSPSYPVTPPAVQEIESNNVITVFNPEADLPGHGQETQPFKYGIFTFRPHPYYRFLYGSGILANPGQPESTIVNQVSPGVLLEIGNHWTLDYTPTWSVYSSSHFDNTLDHVVTLTGGTAYENWTLGLVQTVAITSDPRVETATQTTQDAFITAIEATCQINSKMSTDLNLRQNIISADQFSSSSTWSTLDWLDYQFWPRFSAGIGAGFGYVDVESNPDNAYEQIQGRASWRATDKISFQLSAGAEYTQFISSTNNLWNFIFGAVVQYQPFEHTKLLLNAGSTVSPSYYAGATENTEVSGDLNQRLLGKLYLDVQGDYHVAKYQNSSSALSGSSNREDDFYSVNVQLSYPFARRGKVAVFYQYSDNSSSDAGFSYSSNQVGFQISFAY